MPKLKTKTELRWGFNNSIVSETTCDVKSWVQAWLRLLGMKRQTTTKSGSSYYRLGVVSVRVSDHDVPETDERAYDVANGGFSWSSCGNSIRVDGSWIDAARQLVEVRRQLKKQ